MKKILLAFLSLSIMYKTMEVNQKFKPDSSLKVMDQVRQVLRYLIIKRSVSAATQQQVLNAVIFLYKKILDINAAGQSFGYLTCHYKINPYLLNRFFSMVKSTTQLSDLSC